MFDEHYGLETAVLERLKTKTRRIIKVPYTWHGIDVCGFGPDIDGQSLLLYDADEYLIEDPKTHLFGQIMPKYKVGEIVAVAQCYEEALSPFDWVNRLIYKDEPGWKNKMYVRADLMPHQIQIIGHHVERIQEISDEDCLREGVQESNVPGQYFVAGLQRPNHNDGILQAFFTPREAFSALVKKMSGKRAWDDNPYVDVYEFELVK